MAAQVEREDYWPLKNCQVRVQAVYGDMRRLLLVSTSTSGAYAKASRAGTGAVDVCSSVVTPT